MAKIVRRADLNRIEPKTYLNGKQCMQNLALFYI